MRNSYNANAEKYSKEIHLKNRFDQTLRDVNIDSYSRNNIIFKPHKSRYDGFEIGLHVSLKDWRRDALFLANIIYDLKLDGVVSIITPDPNLNSEEEKQNLRAAENGPITIYFNSHTLPSQMADAIFQIDQKIKEVNAHYRANHQPEILSGKVEDTDLKIGNFCSITSISGEKGPDSYASNQDAYRKGQLPISKIKQTQLILEIMNKKHSYQERINKQHFSSWRAGAKKNSFIQKELDYVIANISLGKYEQANDYLKNLATELTNQFGAGNFFRKESEAYKLVRSIEQQLTTMFPQPSPDHSPSLGAGKKQ